MTMRAICDRPCQNAGMCEAPRAVLNSRDSDSGIASNSAAQLPSAAAAPLEEAEHQGLTLVHFSAQSEPFLTQNTP